MADCPELLLLFSTPGTAKLRVQLRNHRGAVADRTLAPREIAALVRPDGVGFHRELMLDGHQARVIRYEIDPQANQLTVVAALMP